ncbi:ROK family transcriptional regulator [Devosia sp.]|uniref:ROK family transcriptional regulator n=1 Tax=Devosia sp. TaxID=1871048 RepID=UPI002623C9F1|nr:ROK family transcriptional regulator [Devosia sp.]
MQHASLRAANRRAVLTTIALGPGLSNADVSRRTGLAPQTASAIVSELEADGLVTRGEVLRGRRGQPATPLFLDYSGAFAIGCEISWQHVDITLISLGSEEIGRYRRAYAYPDAATIVAEAATAINELIGKLAPAQRPRLAGLGLATPSAIWRSIGHLGAPAEQVPLWRALDLRAELEAATGLPTAWFNDGTCACWAEMVMAPPPRPPNFVYLFVTTFLGAGIAAEHTLWAGPTGNSANLGSMLVNTGDDRRRFGHDVASTSALSRRLAASGIDVPPGDPSDWPWADWEPHVAAWIANAGAALAEIVFNTAAVIEVEAVVIDGIVPTPIVERMVAATDAALTSLPELSHNRLRIAAGKLGLRAPALGAAQLPLFRKHFSRELNDMLAEEA